MCLPPKTFLSKFIHSFYKLDSFTIVYFCSKRTKMVYLTKRAARFTPFFNRKCNKKNSYFNILVNDGWMLWLKNVNYCLNTNIYSFLGTSGGKSCNLYLYGVNFSTPVLIRHLWQLKTIVFFIGV